MELCDLIILYALHCKIKIFCVILDILTLRWIENHLNVLCMLKLYWEGIWITNK